MYHIHTGSFGFVLITDNVSMFKVVCSQNADILVNVLLVALTSQP